MDPASWLGGALGRLVGPHLSVRRNLKRVFPEFEGAELERMITAMWDNLGCTAGERPHLGNFDSYGAGSLVEVADIEHLTNWELSPLIETKRGLVVHVVYRRANNPFFGTTVQKGRTVFGGDLFPEGSEGVKATLRALRRDDHMAM